MITFKLIDISITSYSYHFSVWFSFKIYSQQTVSRQYSTIVTALHVRSPELSHPTWRRLSAFDQHLPISFTPSPWQLLFYSLVLGVLLFQFPHVSDVMQYLSCVWLILPSIMSSSFIRSIANGRISFFDCVWIILYTHRYVCICVWLNLHLHIYMYRHIYLYRESTFSLSMDQLTDTLFPGLSCCE